MCLNKAGRRLTIENSFNTALWPIVLERVNRGDFLGSRDCNFDKRSLSKLILFMNSFVDL
jgi:hypothetical protein